MVTLARRIVEDTRFSAFIIGVILVNADSPTLPASISAPRLVIERGSRLATAEARLAALALLIAAAGSLGLIAHLRREGLE